MWQGVSCWGRQTAAGGQPDEPLTIKPVRYSVTIIDAQQLPKPHQQSKGEVIDPYVILDVIGVDEDVAQVQRVGMRTGAPVRARVLLVPG